MDFVHKFNTQLEERDKVFRLVQYGTRLIWSLKEGPVNSGQVDELKKIESAISFSRQMLRFGKFLESMNASLKSVNLHDSFLRTTLSLSQISNGLYLLCDNLVWLSKVGVIKINQDRFAQLGDSYWLYSTLLLLAKNLYQMQIIFQNAPIRSFDSCAHQLNGDNNTVRQRTYSTAKQFLDFAMYNRRLTLEVLKNLCDTVISMNASKKVQFSAFTVGFVGTVSSLIPLLKYKTLGVY